MCLKKRGGQEHRASWAFRRLGKEDVQGVMGMCGGPQMCMGRWGMGLGRDQAAGGGRWLRGVVGGWKG